jgi:hypothetical protein
MKTIDLIRWVLRRSDELAVGTAEDMRDAALTQIYG